MLPTTSEKSSAKDAPRKSFREVPVPQRSLWESWAVIPAKTRLKISLAFTGFALAGLIMSDKLEQWLPAAQPSSTTSTSKTS
ncbi:hypothetical protein NM688_g6696 [Phlebia brevispora]|uniref:Uncharacterized protein n=1 Tax=Phlebia brevispora TaxID=194682 RepID=A0ACC1SDG9_9APHY|nr:hypothetical protein NM688_g6696 [Phlebia brevispora]